MTTEQKEKIYKYLSEREGQTDARIRAYTHNDKNERNPRRNCYLKLRKYITDFLLGHSGIRWIIIPGFRGVGKTTLLAQLYQEITDSEASKVFLSVDEVTQILGATLVDTINVYEEILGTPFERLDKPLFIFLDEVHYDKKWGVLLKTIFDRSKKVFVIATGSSALTIQQNPDVARRAITEKLYPMSLTEYMKIKRGKFEIKGLGSRIRAALYESQSAQEVFNVLKTLELEVRQYWFGSNQDDINKYLKYGTLPFATQIENEGLVYDQIKKIIDRIVNMDVRDLGKFDADIVAKIPSLLYTLASTDTVSLNNMSTDTGIDRNTLSSIMETLELTETIIRIYPYGAHGTQVRKPSKYLFASPAFRAMYYNFIGNTITSTNYMGKLFEDAAGLYLRKYASNSLGSLTYDSSEHGADFVLSLGDQKIIIEAGYGRKGINQIQNSAKKITAKYGLAISQSPLAMGDDGFSVIVPLEYFLLT